MRVTMHIAISIAAVLVSLWAWNLCHSIKWFPIQIFMEDQTNYVSIWQIIHSIYDIHCFIRVLTLVSISQTTNIPSSLLPVSFQSMKMLEFGFQAIFSLFPMINAIGEMGWKNPLHYWGIIHFPTARGRFFLWGFLSTLSPIIFLNHGFRRCLQESRYE